MRVSRESFSRQLGRLLFIAGLILIIVLVRYYFTPAPEEVEHGPDAKIAAPDGDTLQIGDTRYRLYGIDAPELHQSCETADGKSWPCGREAQKRLKVLAGRGPITCTTQARDRFDRVVAICRTETVPDLGEALVREGFAVNFGGRAVGPYETAEGEARDAKRGLWQGHFQRPSEWREAHPRAADD